MHVTTFSNTFFSFEVAKTANIRLVKSISSVTINAQNVYQEILEQFFCILNQVCAEFEFSSCHSRISYQSLTVRKFIQ